MQLCDNHWAALRKAIDDVGLTHLVSQDGKEVMERMAKELRGEESQFVDPLAGANNMIMCKALELGGLAMLEGDLCPVCEAITHIEDAPPEDIEKHWLNGPAEAMLEECKERGLIPTPGIPEVEDEAS